MLAQEQQKKVIDDLKYKVNEKGSVEFQTIGFFLIGVGPCTTAVTSKTCDAASRLIFVTQRNGVRVTHNLSTWRASKLIDGPGCQQPTFDRYVVM